MRTSSGVYALSRLSFEREESDFCTLRPTRILRLTCYTDYAFGV